jgi:hypothetical protein
MGNLRGRNCAPVRSPHNFTLSINVSIQFHLMEVTSNNGCTVIQGLYFIAEYALHIFVGNFNDSDKKLSLEMKPTIGSNASALT